MFAQHAPHSRNFCGCDTPTQRACGKRRWGVGAVWFALLVRKKLTCCRVLGGSLLFLRPCAKLKLQTPRNNTAVRRGRAAPRTQACVATARARPRRHASNGCVWGRRRVGWLWMKSLGAWGCVFKCLWGTDSFSQVWSQGTCWRLRAGGATPLHVSMCGRAAPPPASLARGHSLRSFFGRGGAPGREPCRLTHPGRRPQALLGAVRARAEGSGGK